MSTADLDIGREALVSVAAKFTMSAFGFVGVIIFARVLGNAGVGRYYTALAIALMLVRVSAGLGKAIKKRVSEVDTDPAEYIGLGLAAHITYVGIVTTVFVAFAPLLPVRGITADDVLGIVLVFSTVGSFQILNRFHAGIGFPGRSFWLDTVRSVVTLLFQVGLLIIGLEAFGILLGLALASAVTAIVVAVVSGVRPALPSRETVADTGKFARWSIPTSVVNDLYKRLDPILIWLFVGTGAVGFYETALRLVLPASQLTASISNPLQVKVSGRSSLGEDVREDVANAMSYAGLLAIPMFFGALALPDVLMRTFFGAEFGAGGHALVGIALFHVVYVYEIPLESAISGTDRPELTFRVTILGLAVYVPLALVLGQQYGLLGVIGATLLAEVVMFLAYQYLCRSVFGGVILPTPVISQTVSGLAMFGVILQARDAVVLSHWAPVVGLITLGAAVYFVVLTAASSHFRLTVGHVLGPVYEQVLAQGKRSDG
ncbi:lipopolysaccharide biosynthesis protein [Natrinema sp. 1APR25-10V2]|uniref:lipopolysaccharide biosynthesis protein n=1 Tax=Natrinema sp. 1APR25-10V2 TaxID=2951081 RepID=UPI0028744936|nr:lipopolysaccharide biosynthesis protein [Natrinema sp. 1APR25-10V2]MDS0475739.1 lipopolysaccharide biosynthesis protein [Natrinema sp. 1APR25-10V2]